MTAAACLLLLGGELDDPAAARALARACGRVACADGGVRHAIRLGIEPRFVIGDMDSQPRRRPAWRETVYWCDFDEGRNDFEKSLDFLLGMGVRDVYVAGALGGRLDHELVNLAVAEAWGLRLRLTLVGRGKACLLGPGRHRVAIGRGRVFSLAGRGPSTKVTLRGGRYDLTRQALVPASRGLSNAAKGPVVLTVHAGAVWLTVGNSSGGG